MRHEFVGRGINNYLLVVYLNNDKWEFCYNIYHNKNNKYFIRLCTIEEAKIIKYLMSKNIGIIDTKYKSQSLTKIILNQHTLLKLI